MEEFSDVRKHRGQSTVTWALAGVLTVLLMAGFFLGAWWLQWFFFKPAEVSQQGRIYQQGYGAQSAYVEQANTLVSQIRAIDVQLASPQTPAGEDTALQAQRTQLTTETCEFIAKVTSIHLPPNLASFAAQSCNGG
jgi:hypothetical protein